MHNGAILRLEQATAGTQGPDALFVFGGLLTDEWQSGDTFIQRNTMDQRIWDPQNTFNAGPYRNVNRVRVLSEAALNALRQYKPVPATNIARMFAFISYVQTLMGEHYCNGTPLSDLEGTNVVPGQPISNDSMFGLALANADSAAANLGGGDSAKGAQLIQAVRGRALPGRGQFAAAAAAGDAATWLAKLNQLRGAAGAALLPVVVDTSYRPVAGTLLAALTDPGASVPDTLRIKLMFRERAFWMFGTGHRLGDMRRLMRQYGRTVDQVYPIGAWFKGGNYGDAIQMPVPFDEQNNPNFATCTDRNP